MRKITIGILAGMGPRSTAPFIEMIIDECQLQYGAEADHDFPQMLILSQPTPFYLNRPLDHSAMKKSILSGLKKLEDSGVSFIVIPCNTAHLYFDECQSEIKTPMLHIVEETMMRVSSGLCLTLFATKPTFDSGIYQQGIVEKGCHFIFDESWQPEITEVISFIKSGHINQAKKHWRFLIDAIQKKGQAVIPANENRGQVHKIISACTDLNAVMSPKERELLFIDATHLLAEATVKRYYVEAM